MYFDLYFAVWNKDYLELFLDVVVPSYLAAGNLPCIAEHHSVTTFIHTNKEGAAIIRNHPIFAKLNAIAPIHIDEYVDTISASKGKYSIMSLCHEQAIKTFLSRKSIAIMAMPDIIISNNSLSLACEKLSHLTKVVVYSCFLRVVKETFAPIIIDRYFNAQNQSITIGNSELLSFARDHLHLYSETQSLHHPLTNEWASTHLLNLSPDCIVVKSFHFHPYILDLRQVQTPQSLTGVTLDSGLIEALHFRPKEITVLEDSSEFASLEISSLQLPLRINHENSHATHKKLKHWMRWGAKEVSRAHLLNYVNYTFFFHLSDTPASSKDLKKGKRVFLILVPFFWVTYLIKSLHPRCVAKKILGTLGKLLNIDLISLVKRALFH